MYVLLCGCFCQVLRIIDSQEVSARAHKRAKALLQKSKKASSNPYEASHLDTGNS